MVGPIIFNAAYLVEGATHPGYDALRQPISALSLRPGGWMQMANFVVFGLLIGHSPWVCAAPCHRALARQRPPRSSWSLP